MGRFILQDGCELRGFKIKLYPTEEQQELLERLQREAKIVWNTLVHDTDVTLHRRATYAVRNGLVPQRPVPPVYEGLEPDEAALAKVQYRRLCREWSCLVHAATSKVPECAFRPFKELLARNGVKFDYQLFRLMIEDRTGCCVSHAGVLQALAKNYFTKSARRKTKRRNVDPMPVQTRSGDCFAIGDFGSRRGNPGFFNCQVKINGMQIRGRLPGKTPHGRVIEGVSLRREADGWWASIKQEVPVRQGPLPVAGTVIGLDMGLHNIVAASEPVFSGSCVVPNTRGRELDERIAGRQAMKRPVGRLHLKAARHNRHVLHNAAIRLATYETIKIEQLPADIGMRGSRIKSSMRTFAAMLRERYGARVREVEPCFTSQDCSQCGFRSKETWSWEHGRIGYCPACGHREDRDVNAARNIASRPSISLAS